MAGGLGDLADRNITIIRKSTHERIKFYVQNSSEVETDKDVLVYPGDHVVVPKVGLIYVLGDVGRPGAYPMDTNDSSITALQAVALAGGINNTAAASKSVMMRKGANGYQESKLPLKDMEKGKVPNIALAADDIIFVPFSFGRNLAVNGAGIVATAGQAAIMHP
jgi:polysaccharide export outer membrane protein